METEPPRPIVPMRSYQEPVFWDKTTGVLVLHWSRQIGKSYTLAAWAVDRLLDKLCNHPQWLVTVLSNSRDNGAEFVRKCEEVCRQLGVAVEIEKASEKVESECLHMEARVAVTQKPRDRKGKKDKPVVHTGRIKVLAANPRTARGFSGDLILDEFAFHADSAAIWEAAEPILSANREFLCRVASTGNGRHNLFYRMVTGGMFKVSRISRTDAWKRGQPVYDPNTRQPITPAEARAKALDKQAYDQNYELAFNHEHMALLTEELVIAAERPELAIDEQVWSPATLARLNNAVNPLHLGNDIGRNRDLSVLTVVEVDGKMRRVLGMLRMNEMRLPAQQAQVALACRAPQFAGYEGDMTGLGLGLVEALQEEFGEERVRGVNFAATEPITERLRDDGRKSATARVTEIMATNLLESFEGRCWEIPADAELRDDLRKPEKVTSPGGRVSIAATRDEAGHADHFWSLALAERAARRGQTGSLATVAGIRVGQNPFKTRRTA